MFQDPISVEYNGSTESLPRTAGKPLGTAVRLGGSRYSTSSGEFSLITEHSRLSEGCRRAIVMMERVSPDPDGPFVGSYDLYPNRFGFIYEVNDLGFFQNDIPLLRDSISTLVDPAFQSRLLGGEG